MLKYFIIFLFLFALSSNSVLAATDPRLSPNNKFGINTLSPEAEFEDARTLVNTNGDWGYVVVTIRKSERDLLRWQTFLNNARDSHIIPIIRLATEFDKDGNWKKPLENDAREWADFLSKLYFPTNNRYIQVYNEVNRGSEWGGSIDPASYANELNKTINSLKSKSDEFYILNAPLDLALSNSIDSLSADEFFANMDNTIPGIFNKIDGWASHSYPNPGFSSSPEKLGRTGVDGYKWELSEIEKYTSKDLPVFITETGWRRGYDSEGLDEETISQYYEQAFREVWNDPRVVTVAPFVLGYPEPLFNQFSFKKNDGNYYKYFQILQNLQKIMGDPTRKNIISNTIVHGPANILTNGSKDIIVNFKNSGNIILNFKKNLDIKVISENIYAYEIYWTKEEFLPGEEAKAIVKIRSKKQGTMPTIIQILSDDSILSQKEIIIRSDNSFTLFIKKVQDFARKGIS